VLLAELRGVLAPFGLNLIGVAPVAVYDASVPEPYRLGAAARGARAAIVIGNGGGALWRHVALRPEHLSRRHPLDDFTTEIMETVALPIAERLGLHPVLRLPHRSSTPPLSFVHLAEAAGLGTRSRLGVLLHPEYGPWLALRGALLVDEAPAAARPAAGFDPCTTCRDRPCVAACPGIAISPTAGWDVPRCIAFRVGEGDANPCEDRCHARIACVYGRVHRYPDAALAHHQRRAFEVMRARP